MRRRMLPLPALLLSLAACGEQEMDDQPKYETYEPSARFEGNQSARFPPPGTVAINERRAPPPKPRLTADLLEHGQERFNVFCSPCHGQAGYGDGMIVQRGFPTPPSFHSQRLRQAPDRHFYSVISFGYGAMFSYAARVPPEDRWAVIAYIRALQLSQNASPDAVPEQAAILPAEGAPP